MKTETIHQDRFCQGIAPCMCTCLACQLLHHGLQPLSLPAMQGAECEEAAELGGCYHDSCFWLGADQRVRYAEGPICGDRDYLGACDHDSCELADPAQLYCPRHGWQLILEGGAYRGFAGGRCTWYRLACRCTDVDERADVRAAL